MELTLEQKNYLHGLSSKKKRRKFLLDCLIANEVLERLMSDDLNITLNSNEKELLKFDMLKEDFRAKDKAIYYGTFKNDGTGYKTKKKLEDESLTQNDLESNGSKIEEAVKITMDDGTILWKTNWAFLNPKQYTEDDMIISFYKGRMVKPRIVIETKNNITYSADKSFNDWFKLFKKLEK